MSLCGDAGVSYFTREGALSLWVRRDSIATSTLGLYPLGEETFDSRVRVEAAVTLGAVGPISWTSA